MKRILIILVISVCFVACRRQATTLQEVKSQFVSCDGTKIHYKVCGSGDVNLVFIHGWGCNINSWSEQYPEFCNKSRMVFIDLPGFGLSDKPDVDYTLDFFAKSVRCVLDKAHMKSPVLIGHSLGTPVCRQVVNNYPELGSKLFDVDGVYCLYPSDSVELAMYNSQIQSFVNSFQGDSVSANVRGFVESLFCKTTPETVKEYAIQTMCNTPQYVGFSTMKNLVEAKYWTGAVISVPTYVMCATNSGIPSGYEQQMQALYSNMVYNQLDSIGHFIMMENPELFNNELRMFIDMNRYKP